MNKASPGRPRLVFMHYGWVRKNLMLVGLLLSKPRASDGFTSGKVCAELSQEKVSDLTWTSVTLGVSLCRKKSLPPTNQ